MDVQTTTQQSDGGDKKRKREEENEDLQKPDKPTRPIKEKYYECIICTKLLSHKDRMHKHVKNAHDPNAFKDPEIINEILYEGEIARYHEWEAKSKEDKLKMYYTETHERGPALYAYLKEVDLYWEFIQAIRRKEIPLEEVFPPQE